MNTHENLSSQVSLCTSDDGYIRLSVQALESVQLRHLDSGLYEDSANQPNDFDKACSILGYTEWITDTEPAISIGWDWTLAYYESPLGYKMVGFPFSNIILQDQNHRDMAEGVVQCQIAAFVGRLNWTDHLRRHITNRYS